MTEMHPKKEGVTKRMQQAAAMCGVGAMLYLLVARLMVSALVAMNAIPRNEAQLLVTQGGITLVAIFTAFLIIYVIHPVRGLEPLGIVKPRQGCGLWLFLVFWILMTTGSGMGDLATRISRQVSGAVHLPGSIWELLACGMVLTILPAVAEELLFRGLLQGYLQPYGFWFAVIGQAVVFGLLHGDFASCLVATMGGIALGLCRASTGSLVWGIVFHLYNNTTAFVTLYNEQYGIAGALQLALQYIVPTVVLVGYALNRIVTKKTPQLIRASGAGVDALAHCHVWLACVGILLLRVIF